MSIISLVFAPNINKEVCCSAGEALNIAKCWGDAHLTFTAVRNVDKGNTADKGVGSSQSCTGRRNRRGTVEFLRSAKSAWTMQTFSCPGKTWPRLWKLCEWESEREIHVFTNKWCPNIQTEKALCVCVWGGVRGHSCGRRKYKHSILKNDLCRTAPCETLTTRGRFLFRRGPFFKKTSYVPLSQLLQSVQTGGFPPRNDKEQVWAMFDAGFQPYNYKSEQRSDLASGWRSHFYYETLSADAKNHLASSNTTKSQPLLELLEL